jgi:hypothetical protein
MVGRFTKSMLAKTTKEGFAITGIRGSTCLL